MCIDEMEKHERESANACAFSGGAQASVVAPGYAGSVEGGGVLS
jgi:hypothetical protein